MDDTATVGNRIPAAIAARLAARMTSAVAVGPLGMDIDIDGSL
jgi:hypothetical protein